MNEFKNAIEDMAAGSLRCVAFAYRSYGVENVPIDEEQRDQWELPEDELVVMAIVGIKVPVIIHIILEWLLKCSTHRCTRNMLFNHHDESLVLTML